MPTPTILVVDDDPVNRRASVSILQREGYHVLEASHGLQALLIAVNQSRPIDLLVAATGLPGIDGRRLVEKFSQAFPATPAALLAEPLEPESVLQTVRELLPPKKQPERCFGTASAAERLA